jgi:membrane-associated protease RseP (regulator of RpoE activity)
MSASPEHDFRDSTAILRDEHFLSDAAVPTRRDDYSHRPSREALLICAVLFLSTCVSTFLTGALGPYHPQITRETSWWTMVGYGMSYAGPLMLILLCHEMGHYLQAVRYGVPASLPFFIPMPPGIGPFGTMGAVIVQSAGHADRKAMFDIAVWGPLAGLVVCLPVCWWGIQQSTVLAVPPAMQDQLFGDPPILKAMVWLKHGPLPENHDVLFNPMLYAGWVGLFLTGLNLMPIGQLDGGHIMYCLIGRRAHTVGIGVLAVGVVYMAVTSYWLYSLMMVLLLMLGVRHPPTADDSVPLGWGRILLGWLSMALLLVCFTPRPFPM